jgi:predicted nucleic acid-binding protein
MASMPSYSSPWTPAFTQLGLPRLLTNEQVMGNDILTQRRAWEAYHRWFEDDRVGFHDEPDSAALERSFHELSLRSRASTKLWADAYLAAFARTADLTLVTFDRALRAMPFVQVQVLP